MAVKIPNEVGFDDQTQRFLYSQRRIIELSQPPEVVRERRRGWHRLDTSAYEGAQLRAPMEPGLGLS